MGNRERAAESAGLLLRPGPGCPWGDYPAAGAGFAGNESATSARGARSAAAVRGPLAMCGRTLPALLAAALWLGCSVQGDLVVSPTLRSYTQRLSRLPAQFTMNVGGHTEPRMVSVALRGPIANATISCDRWIDCNSVEGMLRSIVTPEMTKKEKALAIWRFVMDWCLRHDGHTCDDPLEYANVWGYSFCGPMAVLTEALCDAAGVRCRYVNPTSHGTTEMYWDGKWHLVDTSCRVYYLCRDNRTIASVHDLAQDNALVTRTHDDRGYTLGKDEPAGGLLEQYGDDSDDWVTENYRWAQSTKWDPRVTLRPGETLTRRWDNVGLWCKAHGEEPPRIYANGTLGYAPDLESLAGVAGSENVYEIKGFGYDVVNRVFRPQLPGEAAALVLSFRTPYFTPRVRVTGRFQLGSSDARAGLALSIDGGTSWRVLREANGPGSVALDLQSDLTQQITDGAAGKYSFLVRWELESGGTPSGCALEAIAVHADVQYYPKALPALRVGKNTISVAGELCGGRPATLTYTWLEDLNITLDPQRPRVGLPCRVTGRVTNRVAQQPSWWPRNAGAVEDVVVRFYEGDPAHRGRRIGEDVVLPRLTPGETREVAVTWVPDERPSWREDITQVWMVVDPDNSIAEGDESNNATYVDTIVSEKPNLVLLDPSFVTVDRQEDTVTLTAAVRNWDLWGLNPGNAVMKDVVVRFFDGDPTDGGRLLGERVIPEVAAGDYGYATLTWHVAGFTGVRQVHVVVDPDQRIPERFESREHPYDDVVKEVEF